MVYHKVAFWDKCTLQSINNLPECIQSMCKIFAYDTQGTSDKLSNTNSTVIQNDHYRLQNWSDDWNLYFNLSKCKVMHTGKKNPGHEFTWCLITKPTR